MGSDSKHDTVLIVAPTAKDAVLAREVLSRFEISSESFPTLVELVERLKRPAGALLLAEEALKSDEVGLLKETLAHQEAWSDIPVLVMVSGRDRGPSGLNVLELFENTGNITLIERPFHTATLVSSIRSLIRSRQRQYEVQRLVTELEVSLRQRDEFVSMASHELKTPLTTLKLTSQMALRSLSQSPDQQIPTDKLKRNIINNDRQLGRLSRLIDNLLDVTQMRTGKMTIQKSQTDLAALSARVVDQFTSAATSSGCSLEFSSFEEAHGNWDSDRIEQVVINLVSNAIKYGAGKPIRVNVTSSGESAVLLVEDEGMGIAPENQEKIFERFERVASEQSISGLGLGLFIVRQIVEMHSGKISLQSVLGKGSLFRVELPRVSGSPRLSLAPDMGQNNPKANSPSFKHSR